MLPVVGSPIISKVSFDSLGYVGLRAPEPELGSCEKGSSFLKNMFRPVLMRTSPTFYFYGSSGRGGGISMLARLAPSPLLSLAFYTGFSSVNGGA